MFIDIFAIIRGAKDKKDLKDQLALTRKTSSD